VLEIYNYNFPNTPRTKTTVTKPSKRAFQLWHGLSLQLQRYLVSVTEMQHLDVYAWILPSIECTVIDVT
jgi:hypothetical protein